MHCKFCPNKKVQYPLIPPRWGLASEGRSGKQESELTVQLGPGSRKGSGKASVVINAY